MEPIAVGSVCLRNRIVMPAMCTEYANYDGTVTDKLINYYVARARGGAGLIITEMAYVNPTGKGFHHMLAVHDDKVISGLRRLTQAVHDSDGMIMMQIAHVGRRTWSQMIGTSPVAPSAVPNPGGEVPRALSITEIEAMEDDFARAACRVREAGFDGIEIHMAHGYLIHQFISPYANHRQDQYGGSFENRCRFALNVVRKVRKMVGPDFPVLCKINGEDYLKCGVQGLTVNESIELARNLEKEGVDAITVSGGVLETGEMITPPMGILPGCHVHLAEAVKKRVSLPVISIGKINTWQLAEEILQKGQSDLVAMGRALIADPELPVKVRESRFAEIRPCIACVQGCTDRLYKGVEIRCLVNPYVGNEYKDSIGANAEGLVMIIGGGPAGLQAAIEARRKGFQVELYEKEGTLGGQLNLACKPPHKNEIKSFLVYLLNEIERMGIKTHLNTHVTLKMIQGKKPSLVILATGAIPQEAVFPISGSNVKTAWEVLSGAEIEGNNIVIVGGGMVGCETAEYLAQKGKTVTLMEMLGELATDMPARPRKLLLDRLITLGVNLLSYTKVLGIRNNMLYFERYGIKDRLTGDGYVLSIGAKANDQMKEGLLKAGIKFIMIGDCRRPRRILEAVHEAYTTITMPEE